MSVSAPSSSAAAFVLTPSDPTEGAALGWADFFREPEAALDSVWAWRIEQQTALIEGLRGLFHGSAAWVRLRVWVFMSLVEHSGTPLQRETLEGLFHMLRPDALETVLKRLRDSQLLIWDESQRLYQLSPLAQHLASVLSPLGRVSDDDQELAGLLGQVVGARQLGTLDLSQVQMLQAQLVRLHMEFSDAIASGSEFRLRQAQHRYERAATLIDRASDTIATIIAQADGNAAFEKAARALGRAQSQLLAMASQFNRALQQVDRQRVTLGTTGITSTDVKRWLQTLPHAGGLLEGALRHGVQPVVLSVHDLLDVTEAEFERDRPAPDLLEALPQAQASPQGTLTAVALPQELHDLVNILQQWQQTSVSDTPQEVHAALLGTQPARTRYAQVAYKMQLLPLLGDSQASTLPGLTGELARQPWRVQWLAQQQAIMHDELEQLSTGYLQHHAHVQSAPAADETGTGSVSDLVSDSSADASSTSASGSTSSISLNTPSDPSPPPNTNTHG